MPRVKCVSGELGIRSAFWVLMGEGRKQKEGGKKTENPQARRAQGSQRGRKGRIEEEEGEKEGEKESKKEAKRGEIRKRIGKRVEEEGRGERERRRDSLLLPRSNGTREDPRLAGSPRGASCLGCGSHSHQ